MYSQYRYQRTIFMAGSHAPIPAPIDRIESFESFSSLVRWSIDNLAEFESSHELQITDTNRLWRAAYGRTEMLGKANPLLLSMYDPQINEWLSVFPNLEESYCIISQENLLSSPGPTLSQVARFVGLAPYDWENARVIAHSFASNGIPQLNEDIPIEAELKAELESVLYRYGSTYWDSLQVHGSIGCTPRE